MGEPFYKVADLDGNPIICDDLGTNCLETCLEVDGFLRVLSATECIEDLSFFRVYCDCPGYETVSLTTTFDCDFCGYWGGEVTNPDRISTFAPAFTCGEMEARHRGTDFDGEDPELCEVSQLVFAAGCCDV